MQRIALADDHLRFRDGISSLISQSLPNYQVCIQASNGFQLLQQLATIKQVPDIAIIDLQMPIIDGAAVSNIISNLYPQIKKVAISGYAHHAALMSMLIAGADAYLLKESLNPKVISTVFSAIEQGAIFIDEGIETTEKISITRHKKNKKQLEISKHFTYKERVFLQLVTTGLTYKQIGELMHINEQTVNDYHKRMKDKLGVTTRNEFAIYALQHGIAVLASLSSVQW